MVTNESCDDTHFQNTLEYFQDKVSVDSSKQGKCNAFYFNYCFSLKFNHFLHDLINRQIRNVHR